MAKGARKKMLEFGLDFISAVDRPAQELARVAILKRDDGLKPRAGESRKDFISGFLADGLMKREFPDDRLREAAANHAWCQAKGIEKAGNENQATFVARLLEEGVIDGSMKDAEVRKAVAMTLPADGHVHLVLTMRTDGGEAKSGYTSWTNEHEHPWILDDVGNILIGESQNHTHGIGTLTKNEPAGEAKTVMAGKEKTTKSAEDFAKLEENFTKLMARFEVAEKLAKLNDEHKAFYLKQVDAEKPAFLEKTESERQTAIDLTKVADPVVYTAKDGTVYRKADDPRLVKLAKEGDENRLDLAKERTARRDAEYAKRAREEFTKLPGDEATHIALLRAVDEIADDTVRGKVTELLKATDNGLAEAFKTRGAGDPQDENGSPHSEIEKLARERAKDKDETFELAYSKVLDTPKGKELYAKHCEETIPAG